MKYIHHVSGAGADALTLQEGDVPAARDHELLIRVAYAGVNRPDILQRMGLYNPPASANPFLGLEVSGVVVQVGKNVAGWKVGDEVCGLSHGGGYAEFCVVDARHCLPVPEGLTLAQAAALPENYITVWANLFATGLVGKESTVLVHGGGSGIGLTAIQLASEVGAKVITTAGSSEKLEVCRQLGARHVINYRTEDFNEVVDTATSGTGVDVVLDMVGGEYIARNLRALALDGALVQISFLEGSVVNIDLQPIMLKRLRVMGSTLRARTPENKAMLIRGLQKAFWPILAKGRCLPHIHTVLPLGEAARAHTLMESGKHIGKILLKAD
ncbi:NAD(P)H-quinone oxidoreductase [Cupriavidus pauculus]|uniref:NAD(P)H-quinone oxidoreductase n=1 Tax=Cupriavidus pauculus TaxID=82633 RepID=A0A2N5C2K2_9BURK|nr:NAD(P)H-quinone oxidoreductase [Cupriavidus pauculus]PLP96454.1 NAD(P)H-quinone oxidoreductase [Cupriavidus pauculus]